MPTPRALIGVAAVALVSCAVLAPLSALAATTSHTTVPHTTVPHTTASGHVLVAPPSSAANENAQASGVACTRGGDCTAVGSYLASPTRVRATTWTRSASTWSHGQNVVLPTNAGSTPTSSLSAVGCASGHECLAVGTYSTGPDSTSHGVALRSTGGTFARGVELRLPAHDASPSPLVWCSTKGTCVLAGSMVTAHGARRAFSAIASLSSTAPSWLSAAHQLPYSVPAALPTPNNGGELIESALTCIDPLDCLLVGSIAYSSTQAGDTLPVTQLEAHGHWGPVRLAALPADAASPPEYDFLGAVSCAGRPASLAAATCVAVGSYAATGDLGEELLVEHLSSGGWHLGTAATSPADGDYGAVACESTHPTCVAAGILYSALEAGSEEGEYAVGTTSSFPSNVIAPIPVSSGDEELDSFLDGSCVPDTQSCVEVGSETTGAPVIPLVVTVTT